MAISKPPRCNICNIEFDDIEYKVQHMSDVHKIIPVRICAICKLKITGTDAFDLHLTKVHGTGHLDMNQGIKKLQEFYDNMKRDTDATFNWKN